MQGSFPNSLAITSLQKSNVKMIKHIRMKIKVFHTSLLIWMFLSISLYGEEPSKYTTKGYHSWLPAPEASQGMLIGNGTMGAIVFGHPHDETIILSHSSIYLPLRQPLQPIHQASRLTEIRALIMEGKGVEAAKIPVELSTEEGYGGQIWSDPYIPAFDIHIKTSPANIENYQRRVNFETGEAIINWQQNGKNFERRQFISRADSIMIIKMSSDTLFNVELMFNQRPVKWNEWTYINDHIKSTSSSAKKDVLYYQTEFIHQWDGNISAYEGLGKVKAINGLISTNGRSITVKNTTEVILLVKIKPYLMGENFTSQNIENDLEENFISYQSSLETHQLIHTKIFNRVSLNLGGNSYDKNLSSEVMMQIAKKRSSLAFIEKQFYASRYNILSATGATPPNLQGIWGISWQPPWASDYTHDGNLPTAISSFLSSNMPELMSSYFNYNTSRIPYYKDNAQKLYRCRGIQLPAHSSSHGWNVHFDPTWCLSYWNGGAAWASHFYYDYWLYTNDYQFLKNTAYPFMKEAALFYEDFLILDEQGRYLFNPSYSPENNPKNNLSQATINATMDVMLAKELFRNVIVAAKEVKENKEQIEKWEVMLEAMPNYKIDSSGTLKEWIWENYTENHNHRHVSQLYGMYDIMDPEIIANPELVKGVEQALEKRMEVRRNENGGIMVFGLVQMAWVAANLGNEELMEEIIHWLSSQYWSNSLATFHDPNGLFNMDLSGGFQTVIIRSLVYSEPGYINLLPAKPSSWEIGSIKGILARNQVNIENLSWSPEEVQLSINSPLEQELKIQLPKNYNHASLDTRDGKILKTDHEDAFIILSLPKNTPVELSIKQ